MEETELIVKGNNDLCSERGMQSEFKLKRINRVIFSNISKKHVKMFRENRDHRNLLSIKVSSRYNESSDQSSTKTH